MPPAAASGRWILILGVVTLLLGVLIGLAVLWIGGNGGSHRPAPGDASTDVAPRADGTRPTPQTDGTRPAPQTDGTDPTPPHTDGTRPAPADAIPTDELTLETSSGSTPPAAWEKKHTAPIYHVAYSKDGRFVLSASGTPSGDDNSVRVWDAGAGRELKGLVGFKAALRAVAFSPGGRLAILASTGRVARLWDVQQGREIHGAGANSARYQGASGDVSSLAISPDGKQVAGASEDGSVVLWTFDGTVQRRLPASGAVLAMAFSSQGDRLAWAVDSSVQVLDVATGTEVLKLVGHTDSVLCVAFSPDGKYIATGSGKRGVSGGMTDCTARLWDAATGKELRQYRGHTGAVMSVTFTPDSGAALSASEDGTVRMWDVTATGAVGVFKGHTGAVYAVAASPDGNYSVSGGRDTVLRMWELPILAQQLATAAKEKNLLQLHRASTVPLGPGTEAAAPALREVLKDDDPKLLAAAADVLGKTGSKGAENGQALARLLNNKDAAVQLNALVALRNLGLDGVTCQQLLQAAASTDANVHKVAVELLTQKSAALSPRDLEDLRTALAGKNASAIAAAAKTLGRAGPKAKAAAKDLIPLTRHTDAAVRRASLKALHAVDPSGMAIQDLRVQSLKDPNRVVREQAAILLAGEKDIDPKLLKEKVIPVLVAAMKPETEADLAPDGDWKEASDALVQLGKAHIDDLMDALDTYAGADVSKGYTRIRILNVIASLGRIPASTKYQTALLRIQQFDPYPDVRKAADEARRAVQ
jgi:WD40 repeat protein